MTNLDVYWDDEEKSVILLDVHADYTWREFDSAVTQIGARAAAQPHRCDIIVNLGRASAESSGMAAVRRALDALSVLPDNVGLVVIVVPAIAGLLLSAAKQLNPRVAARARTASGLHRARDMVQQHRRQAS